MRGEISKDDVLCIVAGTRCKDNASWARVLNGYKHTAWTQEGVDPERAVDIAIELIASGRVSQPRLTRHTHFPIVINGQIWFDRMDQIKYVDDIEEEVRKDNEPEDPITTKWSPCYKQVKCKKCSRTYICLPHDDYFNSTCATNGVCESCLKIEFRVSEIIPTEQVRNEH